MPLHVFDPTTVQRLWLRLLPYHPSLPDSGSDALTLRSLFTKRASNRVSPQEGFEAFGDRESYSGRPQLLSMGPDQPTLEPEPGTVVKGDRK